MITNISDVVRNWARTHSIRVVYAAVTGSTSDDAKRDIGTNQVHVADHQTAGRGRGQNRWINSSRGEVLLSTWTLQLDRPPQATTAPRLGLALYRAAHQAWPDLPWGLKAPNDLYLGSRKVAGLLPEVISRGADHHLLVGLGFNVLNHPSALGASATDLRTQLGRPVEFTEMNVFLDAWWDQLAATAAETARPELSPEARHDMRAALNARDGRAYDVLEVSPAADLIHAHGIVSWMDL